MGKGFSKMKKQAKLMQQQMEKVQEEQKNQIIQGQAANNLVQVFINGLKEIKKIKINPECLMPEDAEGLEDLIIVACQDAYKKIDNQDNVSNMPNFFMS